MRLLETVTVLAELGDVDACFVQGQAIEMQRLYKLLPDVVQVHTTGAILRAWDVFKVTQRVGDFFDWPRCGDFRIITDAALAGWHVNTSAHRCVRGRRACPEVMRRELGGLRMRARARSRCAMRACVQHPENYGLRPLTREMQTRVV